jgi:hypothetical protein
MALQLAEKCTVLKGHGFTDCGKSPEGEENHPPAAKAGLILRLLWRS